MSVFKVVKDFTDLQRKRVYREDDLYVADDEARAKELSTTNNLRQEVLIKKLTKKELLNVAKRNNIEVDSEAKVDELHEVVAGGLNG